MREETEEAYPRLGQGRQTPFLQVTYLQVYWHLEFFDNYFLQCLLPRCHSLGLLSACSSLPLPCLPHMPPLFWNQVNFTDLK